MSGTTFSEPQVGALRSGLPVPWLTVGGLAVGMALADGFWLTSLEAAIGAVARSRGPFESWLRDSALLLPLFVLAVLWGLRRAYRKYGPALPGARAVIAATLLVAAAGTAAGVVGLVTSSAYNYGQQANELRLTQQTHSRVVAADHLHGEGGCTATCEAQRATLATHARGIGYASPVLLVTNLVVVGWVVAMRGGRLDARSSAAA